MNPINNSLPKLQLPGDGRPLSEFAAELGRILSKANIFARGGMVFTVNSRGDGLMAMSAEMLRSWVERSCSPYRIKQYDGAHLTATFTRTMTTGDAEGVLASPQFIGQLQQVERFNPVRMPVIRAGGQVELLPQGYDEATKTLTVSNMVPPVTKLPIAEAKRILDGLLGEFVFADSGRSKAVALGAMLTVYGFGLLPRKSLRPCFIVLANAEGAGKTLLVKVCTVPVLGFAPTGCKPKDEEEMRKVLLSTVMEAKSVLFLDNIKGRLSSEALEGFLTSQDWAGRVLGGNRTFTGENNVIVFITGNGCTVSPDMRRRSLFCELFLETDRAEDRQFNQALEVPLLLERRWETLNALWSLVEDWGKAGMPGCSRSHSGFSDWASVIGGIVEHAGYGCPLETPAVAVDTDSEDMRVLVAQIAAEASGNSVEFEFIVHVAKLNGLFDWLVPEGEDLDSRSRAKFASLLKGYDRRLVGGHRFLVMGKGRNRRFQVEQVAQQRQAP